MTGLTPRAVIGIVARHFGITHAVLMNQSRSQPTVLRRQVAMWCLAHHFPMSLAAIGKVFGDRDHTTVLHAFRSVSARIENDQALAADVQRLLARIHAAEAAMQPDLETEITDRADAAVRCLAAKGGVLEMHIVIDGRLAPAVKAYVDATEAIEQAEFTRDEAPALRRQREALRELRAVWHASQPVPA